MSRVSIHEHPFAKAAGDEPLPGYHLIEPLGRGGFGEVWKCEAPGGLPKAVKFVSGEGDDVRRDGLSLRQEYEAFQKIKSIRHPFLLTLERVELIDGDLVMVMELADHQLLDRFDECRAGGLPGIPRDQLLCYLAEAAEALDMIASEHELQHLDVKPANLFVIAGHVKVGDYGLVARLEQGNTSASRQVTRGLTPRYAAPEVARGQVDHRSDQYSLALVYQEMLTRTFPFRAKAAAQMILAHATLEPDLGALSEADRQAVGRALAKEPARRFPSCLDLITALSNAPYSKKAAAHEVIRRAAPQLSNHRIAIADRSTGSGTSLPTAAVRPALSRNLLTRPGVPADSAPDSEAIELISLAETSQPSGTWIETTDEPRPDVEPLGRIGRIWSVMAAVEVNGQQPESPVQPLDAPLPGVLIEALLKAARRDAELARRPEGGWVVRVPLRPVAGVIRLKLQASVETWAREMFALDPHTMAIRAYAPAGFFSNRKKSGLEVLVRIPDGEGIGEAEISSRLFGNPDARFVESTAADMPRRIEEIRQHLQTVPERRKHTRLPTDLPVSVIPITADGVVYPAVPGRCLDVSNAGVRFLTETSVVTAYALVNFENIPAVADWCLLTRLVRSRELPTGHEYGGHFRTDLT